MFQFRHGGDSGDKHTAIDADVEGDIFHFGSPARPQYPDGLYTGSGGGVSPDKTSPIKVGLH